MFSFILDLYLGVELLGHMVTILVLSHRTFMVMLLGKAAERQGEGDQGISVNMKKDIS